MLEMGDDTKPAVLARISGEGSCPGKRLLEEQVAQSLVAENFMGVVRTHYIYKKSQIKVANISKKSNPKSSFLYLRPNIRTW